MKDAVKLTITKAKSRKVPYSSIHIRPRRVALFAPSSPLESEKLDACLKIIEKKAPWIEIINNTFTDQTEDMPSLPYLAGKDQLQASRFTSLLLDPSIDIVWCLRGGYGSLRWLSMVPWDRIEHETPVLIGFSDASFLHSALFQQGHLSIHGPLISTLPITTEPARKALWACLDQGEFPSLSGTTLSHGKAKGPLIGGNLTCITHLIGTTYEPRWDGAILLIEDHNEALYRLDRMLTQLLLTGRLSRLAGIAVGQLMGSEKPEKLLQTLLLDRLSSLGVPIITDLPVGHIPDNHPLLIGGYYELDGDKGLLEPMTGLPGLQRP
ncbi:MAG: LD-carboxypeptidase [Deltaproteobacteria bacterium]|nr:LD-carboxypeptidase [Deltaproteobacteria bacterium]MBW1718432.1 LD-carboxypeptidase [Deltaproteobacteria bacterium]MBW1933105.1 LD-carboxypeptidase [Deltaproteobacteria bacterium]MBW1938315.1 LD-carboxypeptidase [Deltaproteobacteria bacterium]MBW1964749.1 LD-carboxypeptidase [Deltaproteobacteria bacterium]